MDFFSCVAASFLTESSITLDSLLWEFWMALSTVMFMMPWDDIEPDDEAGGGGGAELAGGKGGRSEPGRG